jgi:glucose/mannose-6-phosphate isomerase
MTNLDDKKLIEKLDKSNMLKLLEEFPGQCEQAKSIGVSASIPESYKAKYSNIVFLGLGGSAIGADLIKDYLAADIKVPIYVNRTYTVPAFVGKDTLVFASSYSGNTEETLSGYAEVKKRGAKVIAVTSGGKLKELAEKNNDSVISIPSGYPPRCALGFSFIPPLVTLGKLGLINGREKDIDKAIALLKELKEKSLGDSVDESKNIAKKIAKAIFGKFPVVYASNRLGVVVTRWKGQIAENAKQLSSGHVYPEMNHNEIVGWVHPRSILTQSVAIQIRDDGDHKRVIRRMDICEEILKKEKFETLIVRSQGEDFLSKIMSLIYTGDFVSFYLTLLNGIDPTPVDRITYLKKELGKV